MGKEVYQKVKKAMIIIPKCLRCMHFNENGEGIKCRAYPDGIPGEILLGKE